MWKRSSAFVDQVIQKGYEVEKQKIHTIKLNRESELCDDVYHLHVLIFALLLLGISVVMKKRWLSILSIVPIVLNKISQIRTYVLQ